MATAQPIDTQDVSKKSSKIPLIIVGLLVTAVAAGAAWYFVTSNSANTTAHNTAKVVPHKQPVFLQLDPFTVNLKPDGQFLQTTFTLQLASDADATKIKMYLPHVRSRILLLLSNKTVEELSTVDGKQMLGEQIIETIADPFQPGLDSVHVDTVLVTTFVIQ